MQGQLTIIFSTYQSIQVVSDFAKETNTEFDLVICDEAHRTASFKFRTKEAKNFVKVHDNGIIPAKKRLYMTATKRVYDSVQKEDASREDAIVYSMDDSTYYGETFYELTFGQAIEKGLLSDYEVVIFHAHPENYKNLRNRSEEEVEKGIPVEYVYPEWQEGKRVNKKERNLKVSIEKSAKLHGCFDVFQKKNLEIGEKKKLAGDTSPMKTVLLFDNTIKESKNTVGAIQKFFANNQDHEINFSATHIDGTMDTLTRSNRISWLEDGIDSETGEVKYDCRALSNVRCLSEGVDVPALDAIVFLAHRTGLIDIVQSVGRVMRKAPGKKVGYIIIPIVVDPNEDKQLALESSKYNTVWKVLNALKSHDTRLADEIAQAKFFGDVSRLKNSGRRIAEGDRDNRDPDVQRGSSKSLSESLTGKQLTIYLEELQNPFRGVLLKKVGTIRAWSDWAKDIATILENEKKRIRKLIRRDQVKILRGGQEISINAKTVFHDFLKGLKVHLNQGVSEEDALDILAQQSVTKGVFDALYPNYFSESNNQVGTQLQRLVEFFKDDRNTEVHENLQGFYDSVQNRVKNIKSSEGKQALIKELYDKFFALALPNLAETLGIVYTPIEIVDFLIQSTEDILQKEFGQSLSDESVNILDPFTGTGTFITRLLQSDIIRNKDFVRKYKNEIHASEIVLLAYYMADTNIESVYTEEVKQRGIKGVDRNLNFDNILLRDTFVKPTPSISELFSENYEKMLLQDKKKIQVIIGNPPYSVGQRGANDNLKNQPYPDLQNRISTTYVIETRDTTSKQSLYDSYFKAFRWASDRISAEKMGGGGIIGFVTNGAWLDSAAGQGFRRTIENEFSSIYVFNLRGNARTSGEIRRKERDNVFGQGTRTPICITFLIKKPNTTGKATIHYHDIGDYLTREEKLEKIKNFKSILNKDMELKILKPDDHGDWINQRKEFPEDFIPLCGENKIDPDIKSFFVTYSNGVLSARDAFVNNFSKKQLEENVELTMEHFRSELERVKNLTSRVPKIERSKGIWTADWRNRLIQGRDIKDFDEKLIYPCTYRPFITNNRYFGKDLNERRYQTHRFYPSNRIKNPTICSGVKSPTQHSNFSVFISDKLVDRHLTSDRCFPLYYYPLDYKELTELGQILAGKIQNKYENVTDYVLNLALNKYPNENINKTDLFYYAYGFLHSNEYKTEFKDTLVREYPSIKLVDSVTDFWSFVKAGRQLAELHINYENLGTPEGVIVDDLTTNNDYKVTKIKYKSTKDKSVIKYNSLVTIRNIPERVYSYKINGKSVIDTFIKYHTFIVDKNSGLVNDVNDLAKEKENPRYVLDLLLGTINATLQTLDIVEGLPKIKF